MSVDTTARLVPALTAASLVRAARREVRCLNPSQFRAAAREPWAVVVDVREADERVEHGSIPGALHVPRGLLELRADPSSAMHDPRLDPDDTVLVHCSTGPRGLLAGATFVALGYRSVAVLDGGLAAWAGAGLPVTGRRVPAY